MRTSPDTTSRLPPAGGAAFDVQDPRQATLSIALCEPSRNRVDRVRWPLEAAGHTVAVSPEHPGEYDAIVLDTPGVRILRYGYGDLDAPVIYRHRGNLWRAHTELQFGRLRTFVFDNVALPVIDGVLSPGPALDGMMRRTRPTIPTAIAPMPIDPSNWPTAQHSDREIRSVTLTNCDYAAKTNPIVEWMPIVDDVLDSGYWRICGDGDHADEVAAAATDYEHVRYVGYVDEPATELAAANLMLHPSRMDIAAPNAMLEGLASNLPALTPQFPPFEQTPADCVSADSLRPTLEAYRSPVARRGGAAVRDRYLAENHEPAAIGRRIAEFCQHLVES